MPLPTKKPDESEKNFVSRCMSTEVMKKDFPDNKQRLAVCYSQYKKRKQNATASMSPQEVTWDDCECGGLIIIL